MHNIARRPQSLKLGLAPGTPSMQLSALLALQRAQEPETTLTLSEVSDEELTSGLREGRYNAGLSLQEAPASWVDSEPLWHESVAAALPQQSPLLERAILAITDLLDHPVSRWSAETCPSLDQRWAALQSRSPKEIKPATSFQMLALWVAVGYGIGVSSQSRIKRARAWGLVMRPLAGGPYEIVTYLKRSHVEADPVSERFRHRALQVVKTVTA